MCLTYDIRPHRRTDRQFLLFIPIEENKGLSFFLSFKYNIQALQVAFSSSQCFFILDNRKQTLIHGFNNENEESILLNLVFFYKITKSDYRFGMFGWILFINYAVCNHHVRLLTDISNRRNFICRLFARSKKATRHYLLYL